MQQTPFPHGNIPKLMTQNDRLWKGVGHLRCRCRFKPSTTKPVDNTVFTVKFHPITDESGLSTWPIDARGGRVLQKI